MRVWDPDSVFEGHHVKRVKKIEGLLKRLIEELAESNPLRVETLVELLDFLEESS